MPRHRAFQEEDRQLMANSLDWPLVVCLCLKRTVRDTPPPGIPENMIAVGGWPEFGFMHIAHVDVGGVKVFRNSNVPTLFNAIAVDEDLASNNYYEYPTLDELIEDGWIVD